MVRVEDNGRGIETKHLSYIFQPFFRATDDNQGTGLGLSISKDIIDLHGGSIDVESEFGRGSSFQVKLALMEAQLEVP